MQAADATTLPPPPEQHWHNKEFGFVIYRCVYGDDAMWDRFMARLTAHAQAALDKHPYGPKLKTNFAWIVVDNKPELDGISKKEVRHMFNAWVSSVNGGEDDTRYSTCVYADQEVVTSVLDGGEPGSTDVEDICQPTAFVKLLYFDFEERPRVWTAEDISDDEERREMNEGPAVEEGYDPVDGCTQYDVGWMKYAARGIIPRAYGLLMDDGWECTYARPPKVQSV